MNVRFYRDSQGRDRIELQPDAGTLVDREVTAEDQARYRTKWAHYIAATSEAGDQSAEPPWPADLDPNPDIQPESSSQPPQTAQETPAPGRGWAGSLMLGGGTTPQDEEDPEGDGTPVGPGLRPCPGCGSGCLKKLDGEPHMVKCERLDCQRVYFRFEVGLEPQPPEPQPPLDDDDCPF